MQAIKATFAGAVLLAVGFSLWLAADTVQWFVHELLHTVLIAARICGGLVIFLVLVTCLWLLLRQQYERNRQRDGAFALREYWLEPLPRRLLNWLCGRPSPRVIYDPNANLSPAAIVHNAVYVVEPAAGWDRQLAYMQDVERTRRAQAVAPGDSVLGLPWFGGNGRAGVPNAPTARLLAGAYDKPPKLPALPASPALPQLPAPEPQPVDLPIEYGVERAETQAWPLGYDAGGDLAWFNPLLHAHVAIVGSTGTGKTTSAGYLLACMALRQGWRVAVLDAENGASWAPFATQAEVVPADPDQFGDQIASLYREFERRQRLLGEAGVPDLAYLPNERRLLVIVEEYGDLSSTLRLRDRSLAAAVDGQLDTLLRRGRKAGVHLALLDQYPEHWSNQLIANCKFRVVFQLGPNQGAKMEEYHAAELPACGAFLLRGRQYTAWHAAPHLRTLLADVPAIDAGARLLTPSPAAPFARSGALGVGGSTSGGERPNAPAERPAPNVAPPSGPPAEPSEPAGPTDLQTAVWAWRDANPTGSQADMRREFDARGVAIARGYAHECWHKWPGPAGLIDLSTDEGRARFAAMAGDARLPSGARLGTDITAGGAHV